MLFRSYYNLSRYEDLRNHYWQVNHSMGVYMSEEEFAQWISLLPDREQLVLQLYYVEEFNTLEISEILGVSQRRIEAMITDIKQKLNGIDNNEQRTT